jgi:hypothetical protein
VRRSVKRPPVVLRGLLHPALGPVVRGGVASPDGLRHLRGLLLVDTGAGMSAVDREVARALELPTHGAAEWRAVSDQPGTSVAALRRCRLSMGEDPRAWELDLIEVPGLEHHVEGFRLLGLLGWDFLDQCRLSIDGPSRTFSLELPG